VLGAAEVGFEVVVLVSVEVVEVPSAALGVVGAVVWGTISSMTIVAVTCGQPALPSAKVTFVTS
jgi:hypothetical protein